MQKMGLEESDAIETEKGGGVGWGGLIPALVQIPLAVIM